MAWAARQSSLAQAVLKAASPGSPDVYQGSELWDLRLVDPDNRGPVDFARRLQLLEDLTRRGYDIGMEQLARELGATAEDGRIKLFVTWRSLTLRRQQAVAFASADYQTLEVTGDFPEHAVACARTSSSGTVLCLAGRLFLRLAEKTGKPCEGQAAGRDWWGATRVVLPASMAGARFRDRLTEQIVEPRVVADRPELGLSEVFEILPIALLEQLRA